MIQLKGKFNNDCKIFIDDVEQSAINRIQAILDDEVSMGVPVRIMPDVHDGKDIVIGFTMPLTDRINPNHVGVDIGCGVLGIMLDILDFDRCEVDDIIRANIPMGFSRRVKDDTILKFIPSIEFKELCYKLSIDPLDVKSQIGTLGGGNHFIEFGQSDMGIYMFIHSGSRNFGLQVCNYHAKKAKANNSSYLFGSDMDEYIHDMKIAQEFAKMNRLATAREILTLIDIKPSGKHFDTIHNYIDFDRNIIRKGAISANKDELLSIPMNMRDGVLICRGKGNADWNYSAPHGAGRVLARGNAKRTLSMDEFSKEMDGIYSTSVCESTLDESPMAYKKMQTIIDCIGDTVDIIDIVKPILNIKSL